MQSRPLQPVRQGHLDRLRRAHPGSTGERARGTTLHVPLARTTTPPPAPGRAARSHTRSRVVAFTAAVVALLLAAIPVATSAGAAAGSTAENANRVSWPPGMPLALRSSPR